MGVLFCLRSMDMFFNRKPWDGLLKLPTKGPKKRLQEKASPWKKLSLVIKLSKTENQDFLVVRKGRLKGKNVGIHG